MGKWWARGSVRCAGNARRAFFFLLFVCFGCVNWTLVQSKTHRTKTARCAPPCTQCMIFNACVVKNMIAPCSTAFRTLSFPTIVVIQKVRKSTKMSQKPAQGIQPWTTTGFTKSSGKCTPKNEHVTVHDENASYVQLDVVALLQESKQVARCATQRG